MRNGHGQCGKDDGKSFGGCIDTDCSGFGRKRGCQQSEGRKPRHLQRKSDDKGSRKRGRAFKHRDHGREHPLI